MRTQTIAQFIAVAITAAGLIGLPASSARAHCDTLDGPVVATARTALDTGDVTPLLKWVRPEEEGEIKAAFQRTLAVRTKGDDAKELADMYFFETLVRIHRAGEGAPYTGLKPGEAIDPAVALADKALESGSVDKLVDVLTNAMANGIQERFAHASENQKHVDESVGAGREFVESYVVFTHYVEGLHGLIKGGAAHHGETAAAHGETAAAHGHE
ncbi:MAG: DUF6448 family protein [Deferrisomatales bacterium]|nr:DUF6448 family protein [Deferrisomatales bacterium]